eukprot:TRINITY_DN11416_c0_g1_i11.p1 TRINITY_DN11416_c0_g1~~TRINITY_DN11416_c0_g1_i11.p1  ORF type:complete len:328 (-),score=34.19 TRINITY_DN11416_c0_g1_i11:115-1098(-)
MNPLHILCFFVTYFTSVHLVPVKRQQHSKLSEDQIYVAVKTTGKFHRSRLQPVIDTWYRTAPTSTFFFTDNQPEPGLLQLAKSAGVYRKNPFIETSCPSDHSRTALSCKLEAELTHFLKSAESSDKAWFCHVDDDNYLNTPALLEKLSRYPVDQDWYLGKVSISQQLEIIDRLKPSTGPTANRKTARFWFATGGAGFCLSRALVDKMRPYLIDGQFQRLADTIRLPDDVTLGYLIEVLLEVPLTQVSSFHSHLEPLRLIPASDLANQITFSYSIYEDTQEANVVEFDGDNIDDIKNFNHVDNHSEHSKDPTRFYKIHCQIFNQCNII